MSRLRVLVATPDFPPTRGGIQHMVYRLVSNWRRVEVRVLTFRSSGSSHVDSELGCQVVRPLPDSEGKLHSLAVAGLNLASFLEALRFRPDVVLSAHVVVSPAAWVTSQVLGVPFVQYVYGSEVMSRPGAARFACAHAAAVVAISRFSEDLVAHHISDGSRLRLIPPGVDLPRAHGGQSVRQPFVVTVARLEERYKGHDVLIRAMPLIRARVPQARLVVIGDGQLRPVYRAWANSLGLDDAVTFLGELPDEARDQWLDTASVFALPSRVGSTGGEGFGIVYLEAAVHGLPVVAANVGGSRDAVVDGVTGVLVEATDHVAVADVIADLLADPARGRAQGMAGQARARNFAWPQIALRVEDLLLEVAAGRHSV